MPIDSLIQLARCCWLCGLTEQETIDYVLNNIEVKEAHRIHAISLITEAYQQRERVKDNAWKVFMRDEAARRAA